MSFFKKIMATLTGMEQAPDRSAATEKFRQETARETNLAEERERMQRERMDDQTAREEVKIEVEEMPEQKEAA